MLQLMGNARSCEETANLDSGRFGYLHSISYSNPVEILEMVRSIFKNIALKIFTVAGVNGDYLTLNFLVY